MSWSGDQIALLIEALGLRLQEQFPGEGPRRGLRRLPALLR
jgi:hypothetical protein